MGRPAITVKYPLQPLAALMGLTEAKAMRVLGVAGRTARQYRTEGMSELVADRMAVKAGLVPWTVWPGMLEVAMEDAREVTRCSRRRWRRRNTASCRRARARWRAANRDYLNLYQRRWRAANPERTREIDRQSWARRSKKKNAERRDRYANDPSYRAQVLERQRVRDGLKRAIKNAREMSQMEATPMKVIHTKNKDNARNYLVPKGVEYIDYKDAKRNVGKNGDHLDDGYYVGNDLYKNAEIPAVGHALSTGYPREGVSDAAQHGAMPEQEVA